MFRGERSAMETTSGGPTLYQLDPGKGTGEKQPFRS
jgi:hypothetical protein